MADITHHPTPSELLRSMIGSALIGAGFTGFMLRGITEMGGWFGTARPYPRPERGLIYPIIDHGNAFYVSAGEILLHATTLPCWVLVVIGIIVTPRKTWLPGPDKRKIYNPHGLGTQFSTGAALATIAFIVFLAHPLANALVAQGWNPMTLASAIKP